jgi:hypothetical protein
MIQDGVLQALASPAELKRNALRGKLYSVGSPMPIDAVEALRTAPGIREAVLYGQTIHVLVDPLQQSASSLGDWLDAQHIAVSGISEIEPTLEDIFVSLYSGVVIDPDDTNVKLEPSRLRTIPPFVGLDDASLMMIANRFVARPEPADALLIRQGEFGDRLYVIVSGSVEVTQAEPGEADRLLAVLRRGDVFGELALLRDQPRNASVRTLTPCVLLTLDRTELLDLLETRPRLREYIERVADERLAGS